MDSENRTARDSVAASLKAKARAYDFFHAVRRLDAARDDLSPRSAAGVSESPSKDPVRFCQAPELGFSAMPVERWADAGSDRPARLFVNFMGLLGPNGPMPLHVTEYVHDREHNYKDPTIARFFDLFNHRMIAMFYRAWAINQMAVSRDAGGDDAFARFVGSLFGTGMESLRGRDSIPNDAKLHYAGRLACATRNPEGLEAILTDFFGVPVRIREFAGRWMDVPPECRLRLGESRETGTLGLSAVLGSRIYDSTQTFHILVGPMRLGDYERLLPGGGSFARLVDWVRHYTANELFWDVTLILAAEDAPRIELGKVGRLGWTTWVRSGKAGRDCDDLRVNPETPAGFRPPPERDRDAELAFAAMQASAPELPPAPKPSTPAQEKPPVAEQQKPPPPEKKPEPPAPRMEEAELVELEAGDEIMDASDEEVLSIQAGPAASASPEASPLSDMSMGPDEELPADLEKLVDRTLINLERLDKTEEK